MWRFQIHTSILSNKWCFRLGLDFQIELKILCAERFSCQTFLKSCSSSCSFYPWNMRIFYKMQLHKSIDQIVKYVRTTISNPFQIFLCRSQKSFVTTKSESALIFPPYQAGGLKLCITVWPEPIGIKVNSS